MGIYIRVHGQRALQILRRTEFQPASPQLNRCIGSNSELEWGYINKIAAHPSNGALYVSTNTGLKYTGDGGNSWQTAKTKLGEELALDSKDVKMAASGIVVAEVNNLC